MAGCAMWFGILLALLLCFATAISYAELSKLFPGAGSSYLYAQQAFLSTTKAYRTYPGGKVLHWVGEPFILLGLSGVHGGGDGDSSRVLGQPIVAEYLQQHLQ